MCSPTADVSTIKRFWSHVEIRGPDDCWLYKDSKTEKGYGSFHYNGGTVTTHKFAYLISFGPPKHWVLHVRWCTSKACCNPGHLYDGTAVENTEDMYATGHGNDGVKHYAAKLTEDQVHEIRRLADAGFISQRKIGLMFGVSSSTVSLIKLGRNWSRLEVQNLK